MALSDSGSMNSTRGAGYCRAAECLCRFSRSPCVCFELLLLQAPSVVTREQLCDYVWGNGYLLSEQAGKIAAQIFDVDRAELSGPSRILLDRPGFLSVSDTGTLVIRKFGQDTSRLVWRDRTGRELGVLGTPDDYKGVHLSPDNRFVAITRHQTNGIHARIWIASLPDGLLEPLSDSNRAVNPSWSKDSKTVYYNDERRGLLLRRSVFPRGAEEVAMELGVDPLTHVGGISPGGRYVVAELIPSWANAETVWTEMEGGNKGGAPQWHAMDAPGKEGMLPGFSPDGKWLAFSSNRTGSSEIYVMDFPAGTQRVRISTAGGESRDGGVMVRSCSTSPLTGA